MKNFKKITSMIIIVVLCFSLFPSGSMAVQENISVVGNSDLNILNGGTMVHDGDDFYFTHDGIFRQEGEGAVALSADKAKNLNISGDYIYYTLANEVRRIPKTGGAFELVHTAASDILQLYIRDGGLLYIAGGMAFALAKGETEPQKISELTDIKGLIPTDFGNLFLTGKIFDYTLWAESTAILENLDSCYTDSGFLAISIDNKNYMADISSLFDGFNQATELLDFDIHGEVSLMSLLGGDDENTISEYNDNNNLVCDFDALLEEAGLAPTASAMAIDPVTGQEVPDPIVIPPVSQGQLNMVKRARQLSEIEWTPLEDRYQWDQRGVFKAEATYKGIPYGQPVNNNGYVGYGVSLDTYAADALDNTSKFYTGYSTYNKISPAYSTDCSGYVSYAWGLTQRKTTYSLPQVSEKVGDQSVFSLQVGDCLDQTTSHVVLVSGLKYDTEGKIIWAEIMEQTPVITKLTAYGQGETRSLASLQSYYLDRGYGIYRYPQRDSVQYTPHPAVPLDGEYVAGVKEKAPRPATTPITGGKTVALSSPKAGAAIYYTLDGSTPTANSQRYSEALSFMNQTKLRAIAVSGDYPESEVLSFTVKIPQATIPTYERVSGEAEGDLISAGSTIKLKSMANTTIYYTTDGSEPTTASTVYSSPITVNSNMTIRAFAEGKGVSRSVLATLNFRIGQRFTITASAGTGGSISPSGSVGVLETGTKTFSINPNSGYKVADVLVDGVSQGAKTSYTFSSISANHSIAATFKADVSGMPFTDVSGGAWYYEAVNYAYANKLFEGVSDTIFAPETAMTRGMFVTVLGRFAGLDIEDAPNVGLVTGSDVNIRKEASISSAVAGSVRAKNTTVQVLSQSGDWYQVKYGTVTGYIRNDLIKVYSGQYNDLPGDIYYSAYAKWASLTGIANGVASGSFRPEEPITREHMCMMLYNYATFSGKSLKAVNNKVTFVDDGQISQNAKAAVYALQQAGVIEGMGDGTFAPQGTATRAQVAQIYMTYARAVS